MWPCIVRRVAGGDEVLCDGAEKQAGGIFASMSGWTMACRHSDPYPSSGASGRDCGLTVRPEEVPAGFHPVGTGADAAGKSRIKPSIPPSSSQSRRLRYACMYGVHVM